MAVFGFQALRLYLICLILVILAPAALPGATLTATPDNVVFNYSPPESVPSPVFVAITASDNSSPAFTVTIAPGPNTPATLFPKPPVSGNTFQVGIDPNTLNTLLGSGPGVYTATVTVSAPGFTNITVPVTLSVSITSSILATPSSLAFVPGGPNTQTVSLVGNGTTNVGFTFSATTASGG